MATIKSYTDLRYQVYSLKRNGDLDKPITIPILTRERANNIDIESIVSLYKQRLKSQGVIENSPLVNMCLTSFRRGVEIVLEKLNLKKLEKQGEQKSAGKVKQIPNGYFDYEHCDIQQLSHAIEEQKPADKVELKFKVGDWVANTVGDTNQVVKVLDDGYTLDDNTFLSNSWVTEHYHLWTIQDAKNGDVLAIEPIEENYPYPFVAIYKERGLDFFNSYCDIWFNGKFYINENGHHTNIHPATKEQRDLLFKKMKEAGYEWDAEKKELRKIEQKPAWSEEDEEEFRIAIDTLVEAGQHSSADWLKSLKDRVLPQPKQEWSEEDERIRHSLIIDLSNAQTDDEKVQNEINEEINWLKSLRPQNRWKPSDEQMDALRKNDD